jgi:hypothetical protein
MMMGPRVYVAIVGVLLLAVGGLLLATSMGMIAVLPITLPETLLGFPALYVFGGILGIGIILLIVASRMTY